MTITSYGYAGDIDAAAWSRIHPEIGSATYGVTSSTAWKVAPAAGTRTVSIQSGTGWGKGVMDVSDAVENLSFPSVPSGVRYDMVVMRRDWTAGTSVFAIVAGGSTKALPARTTSPSGGGGVDEQPVALVLITAGSSAVQVVADLRVVAANGGLQGFDDLCRSYMTDPGTQITINGTRWQRVYNSTGSLVWDDWNVLNWDLLWSGAAIMPETSVINLPRSLSSMRTGLKLVWSRWDPSTSRAYDDAWTVTEITSLHLLLPGEDDTHHILATDDNPGSVINKRIYVTDTKLIGDERNNDGLANTRVLRRVYGF